jgi:predicted glycoside hydrolase/deacetylase ChbG (UPF0249 family)
VTPPKRLIVNADDLGRTSGVNRGIAQAHRAGIVSSATLMVTQPAAGEAPALARENPELGIGLHVALTGGPPCLPASQLARLVGEDGRLPAGPEGLAAADAAQVLAEARAQLRRFRELMGRLPTHLDSHHHAHAVAPSVLDALVTLAWETGLPLRSVSAEMRAGFRRERIPTPDRFVDAFHGEGATLTNLIRILSGTEPGTSELMCHPAVVDEALAAGSRYSAERGRELAALTHPEARQSLQASGIQLIHFGQL